MAKAQRPFFRRASDPQVPAQNGEGRPIGRAEEGVSNAPDQSEQHVERLQEVFELIGRRPQAKTCEAIKGILEEGEEIMEEYSGSEALDAGLLAAAQAVEHYEMSRYGALKTWATQLGLKNAVGLLDETLQEEKETDALLSGLAESSVNQEAA